MPKRESLEQLRKYPAFQNLRAKAETHQEEFRPHESAQLKEAGKFDQVIDERTESCWNALSDARRAGGSEHARGGGLDDPLNPMLATVGNIEQARW